MVVSPTFIIEYDMGKDTKEFIISHFFKDSKGLVINTKHTKRAYLEENGFDDLYDYYSVSCNKVICYFSIFIIVSVIINYVYS